jgi:hypothetical protein
LDCVKDLVINNPPGLAKATISSLRGQLEPARFSKLGNGKRGDKTSNAAKCQHLFALAYAGVEAMSFGIKYLCAFTNPVA